MKTLILISLLILSGCGQKSLSSSSLPVPGFSFSPVVGVVLTATDTPGLSRVDIDCRTEWDFDTGEISDDTYTPCEVADIEGKAGFYITADQIAALLEYKKQYWDAQ